MAVKTFVWDFTNTEFNPATDRLLTEAEQTRLASTTGAGHDLTKAGFRTEYAGQVLGVFEKNGYDDSDFCAYVETGPGKFGTVTYGSTRYWTYLNSAEVDATEAVHERYWAFRDAWAATNTANVQADEVTVARVGKAVTVTAGKHTGREGVVGWVGKVNYSGGRFGGEWRARVDTADGKVFVALRQTTLPDHENTTESLGGILAEQFRGAPQNRGKVTA